MDSIIPQPPIQNTKKFKDKYLTKDALHKFISVFNTLKESFKILMASMLLLFVPQKCNSIQCEPYQRFTTLSWEPFVLAFNFLTLLSLSLVYIGENIREFSLIKYFDKDESKPDNNLLTILDSNQFLSKRLSVWNRRIFGIYTFTFLIFIINNILSGILIYKDYYLDAQTITVYLTNILLIFGKLYNGLIISRNSVKKNLAYSLTLSEPVSWNIFDLDN
jgi:hypothetical protein